MKKFFAVACVFLVCMIPTTSVFAAEAESADVANAGNRPAYNEVIPIKSLPSVKSSAGIYTCDKTPISKFVKNNIKNSSIRLTSEISKEKKKVKTAYLKTSGKRLGTVTLYYKTQNIGGRPQFIYEDTYVQWDLNGNGYAISGPDVDFSGDHVTFTFFAQMGPINDSSTVTFTP